MTKTELIDTVASGTAYTPQQVGVILSKILKTITRELIHGGQVQLIGFGTFEVKERNAREGTNPRTGEVIQLPAHKLPVFRAGKSFKDAVRTETLWSYGYD